MWKNAHAADMQQFDLGLQSFSSGPITPTTPIIYGNGTMLSDIGEVTEVESTCGPVTNNPNYQGSRTSPTMPAYEAMKRRKAEQLVARDRERRLSMESTSTITNGDHAGLFADFDDAASVGDSVFQGDDEESVASSYYPQDDAVVYEEQMDTTDGFSNGINRRNDDEKYSALSRRAERILANAKRKLTTMEGNLTRARSSLSSADSGSTTPSPIRPTTAIHRDHDSSTYGHNRTSSENNIPTDFDPETVYSPRASSALGAAGGYRQPAQHARSAEYLRERTNGDSHKGSTIYGNTSFAKSKASLHDNKHSLEPLDEEEAIPDSSSPMLTIEGTQLDAFLSPTFGSFDDKGLRRSASTAQMRDLKDQMNDLKGRLSSLRDQARADSLKRRSMSSLRTPSPFTHARINQWYADPKSGIDEDGDGSVYSDAAELNYQTLTVDRVVSETEDSLLSPVSEQTFDGGSSPATKLTPADASIHSSGKNTPMSALTSGLDDGDMDDMKTEDGYQEYDEDQVRDDISESSESSYHDSVQNQVSHEDREDAFDYEHFFLHSAMGSMSRRHLKRRGSESSYTSDGSVETTRGPANSGMSSVSKPSGRGRRASDASTSTTDSFATATEGRLTRTDKEEELDEFPDQVVIIPERSRSQTPETAKQANFEFDEVRNRHMNGHEAKLVASHIRARSNTTSFTPRPSVSSFESTGTTRSFPLVNRAEVKINGGVLTPRESPDEELKQISDTLMSETASICDRESIHSGDKPIEMLQKEDQILIEGLVASLGRCVLGLTESGQSTAESKMYRKRIDAARSILEGLERPTI